jgi:hypothetical protein
MSIDDEDLNAVLQRMCPQTMGMARHERVTDIVRIGARAVISNPLIAWDLDQRQLEKLGDAMIARGDQYGSTGAHLREMAAAKARGDATPPGGMEPIR